jgi:hypothetical protein
MGLKVAVMVQLSFGLVFWAKEVPQLVMLT